MLDFADGESFRLPLLDFEVQKNQSSVLLDFEAGSLAEIHFPLFEMSRSPFVLDLLDCHFTGEPSLQLTLASYH